MSIIQRAEAYMDAHLAEPITISRICAETACPVHTLERVFLKSHGVTPKQFLTYRRLTALRSLLIKHSPEDMSVTRAALSCGLTHLGRAAVRYRQLFGETPSATLQASSPRAIAGMRR
jgi:AraC-like DNA-binding protein